MGDVILTKYEIVSGKPQRLREWFEAVADKESTEREEAQDVVEKEGVLTESLFIDESDTVNYLLWYQGSVSMERVIEVYEQEESALVKESKRFFEEVLAEDLDEPVGYFEPVVHLVNAER